MLTSYEVAVEEWPRFKATLRLLKIPALTFGSVQLRYYYAVITAYRPAIAQVYLEGRADDHAQTVEFLTSLGFTHICSLKEMS
jgi:hypothetical protein